MSFIRELKRKNTFRVCLASVMTVGMLAGCTASNHPSSMSYARTSPTISFYHDADRYNGVSSYYATPCSDPIGWRDVQVIWTDPEANLEEELTEQVGDFTLQSDEWLGYKFSGASTEAIRMAKRVFAQKGCNLLVMDGVNGVPHVTRWQNKGWSGGMDVLLIRWGSYEVAMN